MAYSTPAYVDLPQGRLAYREEGTGPALVLLHGIPTSSLLWHDVVPRLTGFRVIAPDLLGYGMSDKPTDSDLSVAAQTGYIEALLAALWVERAVIVGHDIGGGVAQLLALRQPGLVERLVLIDSIAWDSWPVPDIARLKEPSWDETMQRLDLSRGFRRAFERGFANKERVTDELVARYVDPFRDLDGRMAYLRAARALDPQDLLAVSDRLGSITTPTLIIWGEQDDYQLPEWGPKLAAALPNARLVTLPDAAHFVPEDAPEQTADLISRFARGE